MYNWLFVRNAQECLTRERKQQLLVNGTEWLKRTGIKSLYNVLDNIELHVGVRIMHSCGHGVIKPNVVLLGYKNGWSNNSDVQTYLNVLKYAS